MKPSDFFLSRRQFLGFLVPGALWLAIGLWICGDNPLVWLEQATTTGWIIFIVASYLVGYVMQSITFLVLDEPSHWVKNETSKAKKKRASQEALEELRTLVRETIGEDPKLKDLNSRQLGQFCKRFAAKDSAFIQEQFLEIEDEVNFTRGISVPLVLLGLVGGARSFFPSLPLPSENSCKLAALVIALLMGIYMYWRFSYAREAEEEAWYRSFLLSWSGEQKKSSRETSKVGKSKD